MQLKSVRLFTLAGIILTLALLAQAQGGGPGSGSRNYNPATEVTVKGTVEEVSQQAGRRGWSGTHLTLKTEAETLDVHVGPSWFLRKNQFSFAKGEQLEVTGSKVEFGKTNALLAREIKKDGKTLLLRNAQGIPQWSRWGRQ